MEPQQEIIGILKKIEILLHYVLFFTVFLSVFKIQEVFKNKK